MTTISQRFRRIGQGFCATVWSVSHGSEAAYAVKREDGSDGRSLLKDYIMHQKILEIASHMTVSVPACHYFASAQDPWWDERLSAFPAQFQLACNVLITDRILPFPEVVRRRIVHLYCPGNLQSSINNSEPNQDCLIRPYLGRRRLGKSKQSRFEAFSLRNYPLHLDQIEQLSLDSFLIARVMAETLANIYWRAHVDANDIEFVLAPPKDTTQANIMGSPVLGDHVVWILDFDCCNDMSLDEEGVDQAVTAFYKNDRFCPRPGSNEAIDQALWQEFKLQFVEASQAILQGTPEARLPVLWVDLVEKRERASRP
ncbi:MAG: hypothetical protein LQ352_001933 [Teloschistes flavicans]|nr:MAG: hypothetical protein LQ352_001933 [Teloschistes flavicans]